MQVLLLDVDGVLNSHQSAMYWHRMGHENGGLPDKACPLASSNLLAILDDLPDLKICVSSSWRLGETIDSLRQVLFNYAQIPPDRIIGMTPHLGPSVLRGLEIDQWLAENPQVERFVILDDDADMGELLPYLVQTRAENGLVWTDAMEVINRFLFPWKQSIGWEVTKMQERGEIDTNLDVFQPDGSRLTYWGKGEPDRAKPEEWALAKIHHDSPHPVFGRNLKVYVK